ncbi:MAG: tRNA lysidine(34) synthetase TilS, partial [Chloroflexota bacterium]
LHWMVHNVPNGKKIVAITIDHGLREESAADCLQVQELASKWGIECRIHNTSLTAETFTENDGREARYQILHDVAEKAEATYILTGHHAGDQAETVLLHLLRGSGLNGLTGMKPIAPIPLAELVQSNIQIARPLLNTPPQLVQAYADQHALPVLEDQSNHDFRFLRNRLRHELIPLLERHYNPQIQKLLSQTAQILRDDAEHLETVHAQTWQSTGAKLESDWGSFPFKIWQDASPSFQRYALRKMAVHIQQSADNLSLENLEAARLGLLNGQVSKTYQLLGTVWAKTNYDDLIVYAADLSGLFTLPQITQAAQFSEIDPTSPISIPLENGQWNLTIQPIPTEEIDVAEAKGNPWLAYITCDPQQKLTLRGRQSGESFQPLGMDGTITLKELMINRKIPAVLRKNWPILADSKGVLWVAGHRLAQRAAITEKAEFAVKIEFHYLEQQSDS